ncbi:hypothetical protein BKA70DRAFT_3030 [Coprinopsis sp. MPI-PUGE-AT-0042]|nr:hypothetical protein BKA70DRAFT_3030 [Coprinopsis sp. MPI-PUGE-AT-0042]
MGWWRTLLCWSSSLDLNVEAFRTWETYERDPRDQESLDLCIKYWRKLLKQTNRHQDDRNDRDQALQYLATTLLAKYQSNPKGRFRLRKLQEAAGLAPELYEETSRVAPDHVYNILVKLGDAFFSAFQHSGKGVADGPLLDSSIEWYRNANTLDFNLHTPSPGKVGLCKALLLKDPSRAEVVREAFAALQEAWNPEPVKNHSYLAEIIGLSVQVYNILHDAAALNKAIELLDVLKYSASASPVGENRVAELWANHGRLLLTRAAGAPGDPVSAANDLRDATRSSERAIQLAEAEPRRVFVHAQTTMALVNSHQLSTYANEISVDEADEMIERLASTLAHDELAQSPAMLGTLANTIRHRRQRFDKEPPEGTATRAAALCTKALETCQDQESRAIMFQSRFLFGGSNDDLEQAMRCYGQAARNSSASNQEREGWEDKARVLGECLKALVEPESPVVLVPIAFVEMPKCVCDPVMLLEPFS